jgi:hypothetical protein
MHRAKEQSCIDTVSHQGELKHANRAISTAAIKSSTSTFYSNSNFKDVQEDGGFAPGR